jgi:hypothetical protein
MTKKHFLLAVVLLAVLKTGHAQQNKPRDSSSLIMRAELRCVIASELEWTTGQRESESGIVALMIEEVKHSDHRSISMNSSIRAIENTVVIAGLIGEVQMKKINDEFDYVDQSTESIWSLSNRSKKDALGREIAVFLDRTNGFVSIRNNVRVNGEGFDQKATGQCEKASAKKLF